MGYLRCLTNMALAASLAGTACAQDMTAVSQHWTDAVGALQRGDDSSAQAAYTQFSASARAWVIANGRSWKIEYLAGSLDCLFPSMRETGSQLLADILQNNRSLNGSGQTEIRRQLSACTSNGSSDATASTVSALPPSLTDVSTHYQAPGVHGDMKGGGSYRVDNEASLAVSPLAPSELMARLVKVDHPNDALQGALRRLPAGAHAAVTGNFAVAVTDGTESDARQIGACLQQYAAPLKTEFKINSSSYMVTAYAVNGAGEVYDYARRLHGLLLPQGVIAYSVPEDMSLVSQADGSACGSMAHELVHLLIKKSFPDAPAWLEEGLASEVAIASPTPDHFQFGWSWRDANLEQDYSSRPTVSELLTMPWAAYNSNSFSGMRRTEAVQSMAAVFIRYLDAKGKLPDVYFAVRDQHVTADFSGFKSYQAILEEKLRMPVASIDADFTSWFNANPHHHKSDLDVNLSTGELSGEYLNAAPRPRDCVAPNSPKQSAVPCDTLEQKIPAANEPPTKH